MSVRVIGPREERDRWTIDTTSRSRTWGRGLSPFVLGPVRLYEDTPVSHSLTMENAWQFAKLYARHADAERRPTRGYFEWARRGWVDAQAHRYPMGRGAKPICSWWAGQALDYVEARRMIYMPLYAAAVTRTSAFERLRELYRREGRVTLWDYDGYDHRALGMSLEQVMSDAGRKMGHAFVLACLLERGALPCP